MEFLEKLPKNKGFVQWLSQETKELCELTGLSFDKLLYDTGLFARETKVQLEYKMQAFFKPPRCFAAFLAPTIQPSPLEPFFYNIFGDSTAEVFKEFPSLSCAGVEGQVSVLTDIQTKLLVRTWCERFDKAQRRRSLNKTVAKESDECLWQTQPIAKILFVDLRQQVDAYINDPNTKLTDAALRLLYETLQEYYITGPLTTQVIEGAHGLKSALDKRMPKVGVHVLSAHIGRRSNGMVSSATYCNLYDHPAVKAYVHPGNASVRHRNDHTFCTFWAERKQNAEHKPKFSPEEKWVWLGGHSATARPKGNSATKSDLIKLVERLFPADDVWFGRPSTDEVGRS